MQILIAAIAVVMIWRGVWGLLDRYLLPENPDLSFIISIIVGLIILLVDDLALEELKRRRN